MCVCVCVCVCVSVLYGTQLAEAHTTPTESAEC